LVADPSVMWAEASKPNDGGAGHLARLLTGVVKRQHKLFHIQRQFTGDARRLMRRLQYHVDLPAAQGDARINRERDYIMTAQRLQGLVGTDRFTLLLEKLCIDERRLRDLLATILYNPAILCGKAAGLSRLRRGGRSGPPPADDGRAIDLNATMRDEERDTIAVDFAVAALRQWVRDLRVLAQRPQEQARFDLPENLFLNLVEELISGAVRRDLRSQLANSVRTTLDDDARNRLDCAEAAAALIGDTLGRYVTWLGYEDAWSQEYPLRPGSDSQGIFAPRMAVKGQAPAINVATQSATFSLDWITAFKALVEENTKAFQVRRMRRAQLRGDDIDPGLGMR
ncbi:MAG: virulence factor SrfC family protein, partial [Pseudomonadota bacterium]